MPVPAWAKAPNAAEVAVVADALYPTAVASPPEVVVALNPKVTVPLPPLFACVLEP